MGGVDSLVRYVSNSRVRSAVLSEVVGASAGAEELIETIAASESAVYEAINDLEDRELVSGAEGDWAATGAGVIVAETIERREHVDGVLDADRDYWANHDVTGLPRRFRARLAAFADPTVVRSTQTDPHRTVRAITERIQTADRVDIVSPFYHAEFAEAVASADSETRLLLGSDVVDALLSNPPEADHQEDYPIRVGDADFSVTATDDCVVLTLPRYDGGYDMDAFLVAESDRAIEWGHRLFESCWADATPAEMFVSDR